MAHVPTETEVAAMQASAQADIERKRIDQQTEGKGFEHDAYGPGVVPEPTWQQAKKDAEEQDQGQS